MANTETLEENGLEPLRCSSCGRFFGYFLLIDGAAILWCGRCKKWNIAAEGKTGDHLTTEEIYDMLPKEGRKG